MTDKPPICLNCNGAKFEICLFEFGFDLDEMYITMKADTWECQDCGTPIMNTEQMDKLRKILNLANE